MPIAFPDIEPLLVAHLTEALADRDVTDVHVATLKVPAGEDVPSQQVVINGSYGRTLDWVRREASAVIDVYADDYATASELGVLVAALVVGTYPEHIKFAEVTLGPVRQADEAPQEKRSMSVEFIVKGFTI